MEIKARGIDGFLRRPPPDILAVLIHGEDQGLARERAEALARAIVPDRHDPFRLAELDSDELTKDPARLADEAAAIAMAPGRRVIHVRRGGDALAKVFATFFKNPIGDALFVIEAGVLPKRSTLRQVFEAEPRAAALACYADGPGDLEALAHDMARQAGVTIEHEAMEILVRLLGGDRRASRSEIDKLLLYVGPGAKSVKRADVIASLAETAEADSDDIIDAAMEGELTRLDHLTTRALAGGTAPIQLLRSALNHVTRLHLLSAQIERGGQAENLVRGLKPGLPYPRVERVLRQLRLWRMARLGEALQMLNEAEIHCKTTGMPDHAIAARALTGLALRAKGR